jgi:hypothetical protein
MASVIIAPQLFACLARLALQDQGRVIEFIRDFQENPASPGISLERVRVRSAQVWSGRVSRDLRAILFKDGEIWAILYADHHDAAYAWAERREIGRHSVTGALQIVESVETVREVERVIEVLVEPEATPLFAPYEDAYLLSLGVPETWLPTVRQVRDDDQLLLVCDKLPQDVAERLLTLGAGELVTPPAPLPSDRPVVEAPDTRRRFYVVEDAGELAAVLAAPLDRWLVFLHPSQRELVEREFKGPSKVSGSAGTGKTVVALHRARHLARQGEKVLLTSFVSTLCENVARNLSKLCTDEERAQITVSTVHRQVLELLRQVQSPPRPATDEDTRQLLEQLRPLHAPSFDRAFVESEWVHVVRLQGLSSWDEYRGAARTGRGRGLAVKERKALWSLFQAVLEALAERGQMDWAGLCGRAEELLVTGAVASPFTAVIVDEAQDLKPPELRFLKALCGSRPENLMLCGDAGQRIYPGGFRLGAVGIDVRGRSSVLKLNYRTTEQIRRSADRMLGDVADDMDGGDEGRSGTRSLLRGPEPVFAGFPTRERELEAGVDLVRSWLADGLSPEDIGVFSPTNKRVEAFGAALTEAGVPWTALSESTDPGGGRVQLGTMHRAKGLEFKVVLVMDCGDSVIPNLFTRRIDDAPDREAALAREQHLLYVAMTRARDELRVSWTDSPSRFLAPLLSNPPVHP